MSNWQVLSLMNATDWPTIWSGDYITFCRTLALRMDLWYKVAISVRVRRLGLCAMTM